MASSIDILQTKVSFLENRLKEINLILNNLATKRELRALAHYIPQEINDPTIITAQCDTELQVGDCVYLTSINNLHYAKRANPYNYSQMPAIGILIHKLKNNFCEIQFTGIVKNIFNNLINQKLIFVDNQGRPSIYPPNLEDNNFVFIQNIGVALDTNSIILSTNQVMTKIIK